MEYRFIWFDLGLTLVRTPVEKIYQQVLHSFHVHKTCEEIGRAVYLTDKEFMRRYPHVLGTDPAYFLPWYLGVLNYYLGIRLDLEENYRVFTDARERVGMEWRLIPGASEMLKSLKRQGIGIGLISNWDHTCRKVLTDNGIDMLFDVTVISSEAGVWKPDPSIFQLALKAADIRAEETLYVGDNYYDDVVGAGKAGIKCLLLAPYGRLGIEELDYSPVITGLEEVPNYIE